MRFLAAACYWLSPAAIILSAYHGNTDSAVAFFLLLCVWLFRPALFVLDYSWQIAIVLLLILSWLRRRCRSPLEVCATIAMGYTIVYGFSDRWAFQYFAWSLPFWFFLPVGSRFCCMSHQRVPIFFALVVLWKSVAARRMGL